jgi:hypothetical protein
MNMLGLFAIATTGRNPLHGMGGAAVAAGSCLCNEQMAIYFCVGSCLMLTIKSVDQNPQIPSPRVFSISFQKK